MKIRTANAFRADWPNGDNLLGVVIHLFVLLVLWFAWFFVVVRNVYLDFKSTLFYNKNDNNDDDQIIRLERFSFECRKVIGFALSTRCDWLKRFAPPFHPIRSKTKANCDALACIFPRFASATCNYFEFWLVQCIVCVLCDWPE